MNDYFAGELGRGRQADYMRQVENDELVAEFRRGEAAKAAAEPRTGHHLGERWRAMLGHLVGTRHAPRRHHV